MSARFAAWMYGALTVGVTAGALGMAAANGSDEVPRILYVHLPAAVVTFLACGLVFVAGVGQIYQRRAFWDRLGKAAGVVAVVACTLLLLTGMMWGKLAWGQWWMWTPRLTFSLILWALYAGLMGARPLVSEARRAGVAAVYGIVAFLDVPVVYMSVKLLPDAHPSSVELDGGMRRALLLCVGAALLLAAGYVFKKCEGARERGSERLGLGAEGALR